MYVTPSQTVGPYFSMRLPWPQGRFVVAAETDGAITIFGRMYDGAGNVIPDGLIETWQADPDGRFAHPDDPRGPLPGGYHGFRGFGRCETAPDGSFTIVTLKPGPLPGGQAPHIDVSVFARGMLDRCVTRIYFPDEADANEADPVLRTVSASRRDTLIAIPAGAGSLRWDVHLQGEQETVFFDL
jgi:protocatechuate 3,4-dioxygenase alpha subunit